MVGNLGVSAAFCSFSYQSPSCILDWRIFLLADIPPYPILHTVYILSTISISLCKCTDPWREQHPKSFISALAPAKAQALFRDSRLRLRVAITDEGNEAEAVRDEDCRADGVEMSVVAMA